MSFKLKELKEELGSARKRKSELVNERASKLRDLQAQMQSETPDHDKEEELRSEIQDLKAEIEKQDNLIETYTDQIADQAEVDGYEDQVDDFLPGNTETPQNEQQMEKHLYRQTANILSTLASQNMGKGKKLEKVSEIQKDLAKGGYYDDIINAASDGFNTLIDSDGGVFLPTSIADRIFEIAEEYGVFSQYGLRFPMSTGDGSKKIPNLLGQLKFYAVNEGSEAKASKFTFSGIELEQNKYMTYVPWTSEMDDLQGQRLIEIMLRKLAEAVARLRDKHIVSADGTSDYHNKVGLDERSGSSDYPEVRESVAATGNSSFSDIEPNDILSATLDIAKPLRERAILALDPDWRVYLKQMKDSDGNFYYEKGGDVVSVDDNGNYRVHGIPVEFTEAVPSTDGASKTYGIMFVPDYYAFSDDGQFMIEQFDTGQIPNEDGTSDAINLLSQDMKAARVKTFFDFEISQITKDYDGTKKGAFTVLKTAA